MDFKYPYTDFHELNLDWFLAEFKKLVEEWNTLSADNATFKHDMELAFSNLGSTVQTFTNFVTNYFDNLDVQQEINNKLDALVADGTISNLLQPIFDDYAANISSRMNLLEGRMDSFVHLTDGSTTGDAELADIRVSANGAVFDNAGNAVRYQAECLDKYGSLNAIPFTSGTFTPSTLIIVAKNRQYTVNGSVAANTYSSMFVDQSNFPAGVTAGDEVYFAIASSSLITLQVSAYISNWVDIDEVQHDSYKKVKIPGNATGLRIRFRFAPGTYTNEVAKPYMFLSFSKPELIDYININNTDISDIKSDILDIRSDMPTNGDAQIFNTDAVASVINARLNSLNKLIADNAYRAVIIPYSVEANVTYYAKYFGNGSTMTEIRLYSFNTVTIGSTAVDVTDLYDLVSTRLPTTSVASYLVLVLRLTTGTVDDVLANLVIAKSATVPSAYEPYYIPVDEAINRRFTTHPEYIEIGTDPSVYVYTDIDVAALQEKPIYINYGTYETEITDLSTDKMLIGADRDLCILQKTNGSYAQPPIEISGGLIKHLTVKMINDPAAPQFGYCVHSDNSSTTNKTLIISDCVFINDLYRVIGMGVRGGEEVIFENCTFIGNGTVNSESIYIHNSSGTKATVRFRNCYFKAVNECMKLQAWSSDCTIDWEFINCTAISDTYGSTNDAIFTDYVAGGVHDTSREHEFSGKFKLLETSHGNNIPLLNA